jgi:hypothetical protein
VWGTRIHIPDEWRETVRRAEACSSNESRAHRVQVVSLGGHRPTNCTSSAEPPGTDDEIQMEPS